MTRLLRLLLVCAAALLAFTLGTATVIWPFYAVIFVSGIARSFLMPSRKIT